MLILWVSRKAHKRSPKIHDAKVGDNEPYYDILMSRGFIVVGIR